MKPFRSRRGTAAVWPLSALRMGGQVRRWEGRDRGEARCVAQVEGASHVRIALRTGDVPLSPPSPPIAHTHAPACGQDAQRDLEACVGGGTARLPADPSLSPLSPGRARCRRIPSLPCLTMTHMLPGTFSPASPPPHWTRRTTADSAQDVLAGHDTAVEGDDAAARVDRRGADGFMSRGG